MAEALATIREEIVIERGIERVWDVMVGDAPKWLGCMRYQ